MIASSEQLDEIVRAVLARLPSATDSGAVPTAAPPQTPGQLSLTGKLVTVAQLERRLDGVQQVKVRRGTIVTPAAHDLLRQRQIELCFESSATYKPSSKVAWQLACGVAETSFDPAELLRTAGKNGIVVQRLANSGLSGVVDELADRVARSGNLGLLFTGKTTAGLCLANRHHGIRAATAACHVGVKDAIAEIGVNLLLIDPRGKSTFQLTRMTQTYYNTQDRTCPAEFTNKLG